jgi:broad specificity phosphatase PhoE
MIILTREEAQQVLDALRGDSLYAAKQARETLRARLAQPEWGEDYRAMYLKVRDELAELQQREWQGLTDEERLRCFDDIDWNKVDWCPDHEQYAKAIEAKLKGKNNGR